MAFVQRAAIAAAILAVTGVLATSARAQSAMEQLQRATDGKQHTGTTFDGSPGDQRRGGIDTTVGPKPTAVPTPPPAQPTNQRAQQIAREQSQIPRAQPRRIPPPPPPPPPSKSSQKKR